MPVAPTVDAEFIERIERDFARRHLILGTGRQDDELELLVSESTSRFAIHNVGTFLQMRVRPTIGEAEQIARLIDEAYAQHRKAGGWNGSAAGVDRNGQSDESSTAVARWLEQADRDLLSTQGKGPVIQLVDALLFEALGKGASDVHIQPLSDRTVVRYRVDGVLHDVHQLTAGMTSGVVSRIKVMGRMDIAQHRIPQDGRATVTIGGRPVDLRLSTVPTSYGERAVVRLLDSAQQLCDFERLGMREDVAQAFLARATQSNGIILVTGPTGSGKTTTLYSTLRRTASPQLNIMTIEDPIEYELSTVGLAVSQMQVNSKKGITFPTGLRHILRQDPDVVMVGEIRDAETARVAIQSSLTGHLVFSTLHTNDAPSAVTRLVDLGVEPYLVSASLSAVLAQRLVRTTHQLCGGAGCDECFGTGLKGRTGLFELMPLDERLRQLISEGAALASIRAAAREAGMRTLGEEGQRLVDEGKTIPLEVHRVVQMV
ncbi:MAG: Flp pilus assembly complex ATPase component TadA [Phycisphaerales bacterium]|nr:Flp pilus assembly complex ATPase component TadA [Phycisphaerales bacterium]